ncbi:dentin sialophosphoprotein [Nothobranchius furzeri]|uniref:Protein starmaker-like n=2 Tax=Nothobranchius furzeri TaxID=105023 RepID=A0A9D2YYS0_NOTFU|nr:protein starmaker-like [Nothobranchius furzeri]
MAAPTENLLSLGFRTRTRENTLTKQREYCLKESRAMLLQQRLQELKDREHQAQRHNKQLLQQFEKAQDTLEEMLTRNAAMKTIRMEYERYLEENSPRWQQQLQEAAQQKKMEDCSRVYQQKSEENEVLTSTVDAPKLSHDPSMQNQKCVPSHENSDYPQSSFSHHPFSQLTSTQTHTGRFPGFLTALHRTHSPLFFPPPNFLLPHSFLLQHPTSSLGHQRWSKQEASGWDPGSSGSVGRFHTENPPPSSFSVGEGNETSGATNTSKKKDGGLSPGLDVKPVRLSSSHEQSSGSSRGSPLAGRDKRKRKKKRGRGQQSSPDSQKSYGTSNKIIVASLAADQSSERNSSSVGSDRSNSSTEREAPVGSPLPEGETENRREDDGESQHSDEEESSLSKKMENQSHDDKSLSCRAEESGGDVENKSRAEEEIVSQEGSSDEERDEEEETKDLEAGDEENSWKSQEQVGDAEGDDEVSTGIKTTEDVEHQEDEQLNNKDTKIRTESSASSQDEEEDGSEDDEESNKEDRNDEAEDSCDSDEIISPQEKRSEQMQTIPEDDEDEVKTQSSDESTDDAIENLLAPPGAGKVEEDERSDQEPTAACHNMNIFQVTDTSKVDHIGDSDEFDHFYD